MKLNAVNWLRGWQIGAVAGVGTRRAIVQIVVQGLKRIAAAAEKPEIDR